jgi:hypothetical protein
MTRTIALAALLTCITSGLLAQCSDAGACSIGAMEEGPGHHIGVRYAFGKSGKADGLTFHAVEVEADVAVSGTSRLMISMPWSRSSGPAGSLSGPGDLTVLWHQQLTMIGPGALSVQAGARLATGESDGGGLPQAYQPGLGTNDILFGLAFTSGDWHAAAGYQVSRGRSANAITRLRRGDDLMLRAGYATDLSSVRVGLDLLAIKRLHTSSVAGSTPGVYVDVPGSNQFQVNVVPSAEIPLAGAFALRIAAALPLRSREVNVDGLTRSLTLLMGVEARL